MVATVLNGVMAHAAMGLGSAPDGMRGAALSAGPMATASSLQEMAMPAAPAASANDDSSDCGGAMHCVDGSTGQCLATASCHLFAAGVVAPLASSDLAGAAPPLVSPSEEAGRFLTGAPDRPPRQLT